MSRPEHTAPPEIYYNAIEAKKYTNNSRVMMIQHEMTLRALELLNIDPSTPSHILDIGCGSGLSGQVLEEQGHHWVGLDISADMLEIGHQRQVDGDLFLQDLGQGLGFRPGSFDGAISISVLQWLCNADQTHHVPRKRLSRFFSTLYTSLARGARAVFQFYPESPDQVEMIVSSAMKAGFTGGLVVDYPNSTKAKKNYLCLFAGVSSERVELPRGLTSEHMQDEQHVSYARERIRSTPYQRKKNVKDKDWILRKKELNRTRGKQVPNDSKFTARKRRPKF